MTTQFDDLVEYSVKAATFNEYEVQRESQFLANLVDFRLDEAHTLPLERLGDAFRRIRDHKMKIDLCYDRFLTILEQQIRERKLNNETK